MQMSKSVRRLLALTKIIVYPDDYIVVSIPRKEEAEARCLLCSLEPFSSVTFDTAEVSVVLRAERWEGLRERLSGFVEEGPYRLVTFDIVLDLSVVGFLAAISDRLAEADISIYALSTFLRDHILVKKEDADRAEETLQHLIDECRRV